jgi:glycerol-3-phosphate dehydrogenase
MFIKWLISQIKKAEARQDVEYEKERLKRRTSRMQTLINNRENDDTVNVVGMKLTLYPAVGGHVLEAAHYEEKNDEWTYKLYMINESDDFAKQVSQAIMMESLKQ